MKKYMSILISGPLNFSADVMKWVSTDVSWKWQHVSLLPGWCSPLVYRCVAWCTHRMAHCHFNKISLLLWQGSLNWVPCQFYQTVCYRRLKLFSSLSPSVSLLLLWNMLVVESSVTKVVVVVVGGWEKEKKVKDNNTGIEREIKNE